MDEDPEIRGQSIQVDCKLSTLTSSNGNSDRIAPSFSANESCVNLTFRM